MLFERIKTKMENKISIFEKKNKKSWNYYTSEPYLSLSKTNDLLMNPNIKKDFVTKIENENQISGLGRAFNKANTEILNQGRMYRISNIRGINTNSELELICSNGTEWIPISDIALKQNLMDDNIELLVTQYDILSMNLYVIQNSEWSISAAIVRFDFDGNRIFESVAIKKN